MTFRTYKCSLCGRSYMHNCGDAYIYKNRSKKYCSYTCWRSAGNGTGKPQRERKRKVTTI